MRKTSSYRSFKEHIWQITFLLTLSFLVSCATTTQKPAPKKFTPKPAKVERTQEEGVKMEVIRPEPKPLTVASTPRAKASVNVVEEGRKEMAAGNFEQAEKKFQEAINIDPNNGIAYYYLAKAKFELGKYSQAEGVLDKAEDLLAGSADWLEAVSTLRGMIKEKL